jgi:membrane fusion protein, macrolide-specific efflux system
MSPHRFALAISKMPCWLQVNWTHSNGSTSVRRFLGQVKSLKVKLGDRVTKGQPIADIDDLPQRNDLRNAEAALNVAKADLQAKQALLKQAESRFKRQKRMLNDEAGSREDFEAAEATLAATRAELIALNARIVQAQN